MLVNTHNPKSIRLLKSWIAKCPERINWQTARRELNVKMKRKNRRILRIQQLSLFSN